jgi:uncharacterized protein YlxW (UPF0749 family)
MKAYRNVAITLVCIILGTMLAWQYKSINFNLKAASLDNKRIEDLKDELILEKRNNDDLRNRNSELEKSNKEFENAQGQIDKTAEVINKELERARTIAGLTDVKGKGIIITLENTELGQVDDSDILDVLNELRASDAQAISVNDERIIATSEVRVGGSYILINRKQTVAPFVIKAIADPDKLENSLKMLGGVIEKLNEYQIKVTIIKSDNIVIPKVRDDGSVIKTDMLTPVK